MIETILQSLLPIFLKLWWLIALVIIIAICRLPSVKGWIGEAIVNFIAKLSLNKKVYHLIKNVTIHTEDGTTQIDHIIVSIYGVFVVETKNYKGWIWGSKDYKQKEWTQQIYKVKNKFQNPLRQNYKHTKTLENILDLSDKEIYSVIVFIGDSTFKTDMPENVTKGIGYVKHIKSFKTPVLTAEKVADIITTVSSERLKTSFKTHSKHVKHVKDIIKSKKEDHSRFMPKVDTDSKSNNHEISRDEIDYKLKMIGICSKCNNEMVFCMKESRYFWRCELCNNDFNINETCSNCDSQMYIEQKENDILLICSNCGVQRVYMHL